MVAVWTNTSFNTRHYILYLVAGTEQPLAQIKTYP